MLNTDTFDHDSFEKHADAIVFCLKELAPYPSPFDAYREFALIRMVQNLAHNARHYLPQYEPPKQFKIISKNRA